MQNASAPPAIGVPAIRQVSTNFVMTEREAHEAWARLIGKKPRAAALLHHLVANMGHLNAVVVSQKVLGKMMGVTDRTIRTAVADLVKDRWIDVVNINGPGTVCAYVVNDQVAWGQSRDQMKLSIFTAAVIADSADQPEGRARVDLRRIPQLYDGERQIPSGPGEAPPSQPAIGSLEPDLPALKKDGSVEEAVSSIEKMHLARE